MIVVWLPQAIDDLESVRAFIAEDKPAAAQRIVLHIVHNIDSFFPASRAWDGRGACPARASL